MQKPRHRIHDWNTKNKIYISTNKRKLKMDNT